MNTVLPLETAKFYAAQIVSTLEYLHNQGIAHRDLKPENMMLDHKMHIKIIDFATAKIVGKTFNKLTMKFEDSVPSNNNGPKLRNPNKRHTFVGTAEYVSPEVLSDIESGIGTDLWALGCIIYQMLAGSTPFKDKTEYLVFKRIMEKSIEFPSDFPQQAKDLVKSLLVQDPFSRLGSGTEGSINDYNSLKNQPFFQGINFNSLNHTKVPFLDILKTKVEIVDLPSRSTSNDSTIENKAEIRMEPKVDVKVVKDGIVQKKSPWFHYNIRRILLYSSGKMEYIDPEKNLLKGTIYLSYECKCICDGDSKFELITPKRTFIFKTEKKDSKQWAAAINDVIPKKR